MDIAIDRCTLRVVRRGGWSWRVSPDLVARNAVAALTRVLERELESRDGGDDAERVVERLRLTVRLTAHELRAVEELAHDETAALPALDAQITQVLDAALAADVEHPPETSPHPIAIAEPGDGSAMATTLRRWHRVGRLRRILERLDAATLRVWHDWLWRRAEGVPAGAVAAAVTAAVRAVRGEPSAAVGPRLRPGLWLWPVDGSVDDRLPPGARNFEAPAPPAEISPAELIQRLVDATEVALTLGRAVDDPEIWRAILGPPRADAAIEDRRAPPRDLDEAGGRSGTVESGEPESPVSRGAAPIAPKPDEPSSPNRAVADDGIAAADASPTSTPRVAGALRARPNAHASSSGATVPEIVPAAATAESPEWQAHVESALPFLLLGPLAQLGWLDTLAACAEVGEWSERLPAFAVALGYKVLAPVRHGWDRPPAAARSGATFAGLTAAPPESDLVVLAHAARVSLAPLDAVLSEALLDERVFGTPLVLAHSGSNQTSTWAVFEADALRPLAWAVELDDALALMDACRPDPILIASGGDARALRRLDGRGIRFMTAGELTRGERWRDLGASPVGRVYTNDRTTSTPALRRLAARLPPAVEATAALFDEFLVRRRSVPLATDDALERTVTYGALAALGTLAWTLWHDREPVDPVLAWQRLHDLDGRVHVTPAEVSVRVPLGKRSRDLRAAGCLDDIVGVPWLRGRRVVFSAG